MMFQHKKNGSWVKPKYVPADALVRYWCGDEGSCLELLKSELFQACKDGHVRYRMKVHKLNYPVEVLFAENNLYIHLESFDKWAVGYVEEKDNAITQSEELEYYQNVEVDEEAFAEQSNEFQREINKAEAAEEARKAEEERLKAAEAKKLTESDKSYTPETYELVIATLDECLMGRFKDKKFRTDKDLRQFLSDIYGDLNGISVSNLNHVIPNARKRLKKTYDPKENESEILKRYKLQE